MLNAIVECHKFQTKKTYQKHYKNRPEFLLVSFSSPAKLRMSAWLFNSYFIHWLLNIESKTAIITTYSKRKFESGEGTAKS